MAKKRANATKKKQVARKKRLSSTYGVSVLKGGTQARKNGALDANANPVVDGNSHAQKQNGASSNGEGNAKNIALAHNRSNGNNTLMSTQVIQGKRSRDRQGENDEFQRMHASLEERSRALKARKDDQRSKKGRQKQQKKGWGKFATPTNFAPATLTLAPKTTQELVNDAADQVAQGMNEIGQQARNPFYGVSTIPGQSSLAAAASLNWEMQVLSNVGNQAPQSENQKNSFAAFDEDSDSDNEWGSTKIKAIQQFQFKPASFSFQPTISNPPADDDDIDPDL
mmetsp:Transcript_41870/g.75441  ORF Transcript_41870/g.75441 Transcript_41870/m.75441 type:complete len:282 (-) Transcript_41870:52-897(-)